MKSEEGVEGRGVSKSRTKKKAGVRRPRTRPAAWRAHKSPPPPLPQCTSGAVLGRDEAAFPARADMGTALAWRLAFGLLVLALLSPSQAADNGTTTTPMSNKSNVTSTPPSTVNNTTPKGHGNSLQSTAGLFILSVSFLYIC